MSYYSPFSFQDAKKQEMRLGGRPAPEVLARMRAEGVEILGLGRANLPLLTLLPSLGIPIRTVRDRHPPQGDVAAMLAGRDIACRFGEGYLHGLSARVLIRTPSLRPDLPAIRTAVARGATVITEAALSLSLCPADLFAVTGSDGKTTTAMMTAALLRRAGRRVHLAGNIGTPLAALLDGIRPGDAAVLELSSFQLFDIDPPFGRTAITNLTENHLDWHRDMEEYRAAKARILGDGVAVLPAGGLGLCAPSGAQGTLLFTKDAPPPALYPLLYCRGDTVVLRGEQGETPLFPCAAVTLPGRHHLANAMTAAALTLGELSPDGIAAALSAFRGAPHRAECLGRVRGVLCYDSSIDTTPARTATTLLGMKERPVVILGGRGKGVSFRPLAGALAASARAAVITGECAGEIEEAIRGSVPYVMVADFEEAVIRGLHLAEGGVLLLSPAATAYDRFTDYRERGRTFAAILEAQK